MKRYRILFPLLVAVVLIAGCKGKKTGDGDIITTNYETPQLQAPISMNTSLVSMETEWAGGRTYHLLINRFPVDSLPKVSDERGQLYKDNKVEISVTRSDGSTFFSHSFTKMSFANWLDSDYRSNGLLEDIHFFRADDDELLFTVSVNHPAASDDEATILRLAVNREGAIAIGRYDENDRDDLAQSDEEE